MWSKQKMDETSIEAFAICSKKRSCWTHHVANCDDKEASSPSKTTMSMLRVVKVSFKVGAIEENMS